MRIPLWSRLRLAPRIVLVVLGSLVAVSAVDKAMPFVIRPPEIMFFDRQWLLDNLREIRDRNDAASPAERQAMLQKLPIRRWLDVMALDAQPKLRALTQTKGSVDLHRQIAGTLGLPLQDVLLMVDNLADPDRSPRPLVAILPTLPLMVDIINETTDSILTSDLRIAFRTGANDWLLITPKSDGQEAVRMIRNFILPLLGLALVAALAIWVARGIVRPLSDLATAAEKLGRERELSLVGRFDAPELQAIGNSFNDMQQRLKSFVDERLQMIAAISHDLRTPLTRLRLFAEYVPDPDQRRQVLSDINDMETMMSATLTFASSRLTDEPHNAVDLASLMISLCDTAADAGCAVNYEGPDHASLACQPVAMRRALSNLIDNGCKFASQVSVRLRDAGRNFIITIADNGPGIPADQREDAFRPFKRLESSRNRETGGTGLGLTIARDIILAHHGSINLDKSEPGGLLVTVMIPCPVAAA